MLQSRQMFTESVQGCALSDKSLVSQFSSKWAPLLEGIEDELDKFAPRGQADYLRAVTSVMLENESNYLRRLSEETRALSVGPFMKFVLPVVRRSAVRLVATQIASVQPMTGPIGGVAFFRPRYNSNKGSVAKGTEMNKVLNKWYSSNYIDGESFGVGNGSAVAFNKQVDYPRMIAGSVVLQVNGVQVATDNGNEGWTNLSGVALGGGGSLNYQNGQVSFTFGTAPASGHAVVLRYRYDNELNSRIGEVGLDISVTSIQAESRKLKSLTSVEAADDLRSMWGRDIDADLVAQMSDHLTAEIDREIAGTAFQAVEPGAILKWDRQTPAAVTEMDHLQSLVVRMSEASHLIHRRTQRAPANWCITSSEVAALLDTMPGFSSVDDGHVYQGGVMKGGVLNRKWVIYVDPEFPSNEILMGYQGPSILDSGLAYCPYVPIELSPMFYDPSDQSMRRSIRTRHKVQLLRPEFFSRIQISGLN